MDPLMKRRVMDRLRTEARNGRTILMTTQVLSPQVHAVDAPCALHRPMVNGDHGRVALAQRQHHRA